LRIKVLFSTSKIPILYRHRFMALIKEALEKSDRDFKEALYPDEDSEFSKKVKPFSFSISLPPGRKMTKEKFIIDKDFKVEDTVFYFPENSFLPFYISSYDYEFMVNLYNGLLELKDFRFSEDIILRLEKVYMLNERKNSSYEVTFKTNSPILIEDENDKPLLPVGNNGNKLNDNEMRLFNHHFNAIHDRILKDLRKQGLFREIEFVPLKVNKQVVKHTLSGFRQKTGKPYMTLTTFQGRFKLKGDPRDLQMLYQIGVGLRTGQGFGMVEAVG